jgi:hypothetical protein
MPSQGEWVGEGHDLMKGEAIVYTWFTENGSSKACGNGDCASEERIYEECRASMVKTFPAAVR